MISQVFCRSIVCHFHHFKITSATFGIGLFRTTGLLTTRLHFYFRLTDVKEVYARNEFATLEITLVLKRNDPYYTLTRFVPIMVLTFLTPIGLILPGEFLKIFHSFKGLGLPLGILIWV